jgi:hypothetical protein
MNGRLACAGLAAVSLLASPACRDRGAEEGASPPAAKSEGVSRSEAVTAVAERLLAAHHLLGRQPEELTKEEKDTPVDQKVIEALVADLGAYDPFIRDLYVGFVVGALARHQGRWITSIDGDRATIAAGDVRVAFVRKGD